IVQGFSLFVRKFGAYAVYPFSIKWNIKPIRFNQVALMLNEFAHRIVQLPGNLDTTWPVICIGNRCVPTLGETGSFGIKNQIHRFSKKTWLDRKYPNKLMVFWRESITPTESGLALGLQIAVGDMG